MKEENKLKATDLRIGNFLQWKGSNAVVKIKGIAEDENSIWVVDYFDLDSALVNTIYLIDFEPIPLNEEWLKRFGFEWCKGSEKNHSHIQKNLYEDYGTELLFYFEKGDGVITNTQIEDNSELGYVNLPPLKFVHQLQNLYHALCGTELTLK